LFSPSLCYFKFMSRNTFETQFWAAQPPFGRDFLQYKVVRTYFAVDTIHLPGLLVRTFPSIHLSKSVMFRMCVAGMKSHQRHADHDRLRLRTFLFHAPEKTFQVFRVSWARREAHPSLPGKCPGHRPPSRWESSSLIFGSLDKTDEMASRWSRFGLGKRTAAFVPQLLA